MDYSKNTTQTIWRSAGEMATAANEVLADPKRSHWVRINREISRANEWSGNLTLEQSLEASRFGLAGGWTDKMLSKYEDLGLDSLLTSAPSQWEPAIVGHVPLVPAAVQGLPMSMLAKSGYSETNSNPVTIAFNRMVSSAISENTVEGVGLAVFGLAQCVSRVRPVNLLVGLCCGSSPTFRKPYTTHLYWVDMGTSPWDVEQVLYCTAHTAMIRRCLFDTHQLMSGSEDNIPWPWDAYDRADKMDAGIRQHLGMTEQDILVGGARMSEMGTIAADPKAWIKGQLDKILECQ